MTILMALREIRRSKLRSFLTTLGIVIGVGSVIAMVSLGRAATAKVTADIASMGSNLLTVAPGAERRGPASGAAKPFTLDDAKAISREVSGVGAVAPVATKAALVVYGNKNWSTSITGTTNDWLTVRGFRLARGSDFSEAQAGGGAAVCVLGATVEKELFGAQDALGELVRVGSMSCSVIGVAASKGAAGMGMDQDDFVLMPLATVQRRLTGTSDVNMVFVSAKSDRLTPKVKSQIESLMAERRRILPGQANDFHVEDMKEIAKTMTNVTGALTALLGAIAGVSLVVGGIGIMNIMLVSVTERTREIGLRLSIGALAGEVLLQFLVEAITLSTLGGVGGVVLGLGVSWIAARALSMPFTVAYDIVAVAVLFSGLVGVVFGFVPARRASRLEPIVALRYE